VVTSDEQLELWLILEEVPTHEACSEALAAGKCLDLRLGPPLATFGASTI